jgi:hypothetical protein
VRPAALQLDSGPTVGSRGGAMAGNHPSSTPGTNQPRGSTGR